VSTAAPAAPAVPNLRAERWRLRLRSARTFARRFSRRVDGVVGLVILLVFAVIAIAPQWFVGPLETVSRASGTSLQPPVSAHVFGTDEVGRDLLNLTIHGARISMAIGFMATLITVVVGAVLAIAFLYVVLSLVFAGWGDHSLPPSPSPSTSAIGLAWLFRPLAASHTGGGPLT